VRVGPCWIPPLGAKSALRQYLKWTPPLILGISTAALNSLLPDFRIHLLSGWLVYGILALSLAFVWGQAGIFSFGQPAFFGVGGYIYGIIAITYADTTGETVTALIGATFAGACLAALLGYFMFYGRVGDVYVGIITLAVTLVLFTVVGATSAPIYKIGEAFIGGYNGLRPIPRMILPGGSAQGLTIRYLYWFVVVTATTAYLISLWITKRPLGRIFAGIRENELRAELLGYDVRWHKLQAFTIGGAIAGLAGGLFAGWAGVVTPAVFSLAQMALVVIWVLVGGRMSLLGAFAGTLIVQALSFNLGGAGGILRGQTPLVLGIVFVLFVLLLPGGLIPCAMSLWRWGKQHLVPVAPQSTQVPAAHVDPASALGEASLGDKPLSDQNRLEVRDLSKTFGGQNAVNEISLEFVGPGLYCIIGPNGAGKSTLFNLLLGRYPPTNGRILLDGRDITRMPLHRRAHMIGVKLQHPTVFPGLAVRENTWLAAYAQCRDTELADRQARGLLARVRLSARAGDLAGDLSHGEQQWLELAIALAQNQPIILLDEPTAGMTRGETLQIVPVVQQLADRHIVIVVEHDMTFVDRLKSLVIVLHQGKVFAQGAINELRENEAVIDIYLGRSKHVGDS
jgi:branched-chain amino acid transport system permease protein